MATADSDPDAWAGTDVLHIGFFFDGTRNNARNLDAGGVHPPPMPLPAAVRAEDASTYQSRPSSSHDNGPTNIARLHRLYADTRDGAAGPLSLAIYTEGVGTRDGQSDDLIGLAFGTGATGIRAKTERALREQLPDALRQLSSTSSLPIAGVRVDLFGYSRGGASARAAAVELAQWPSARWQGLLREAGLTIAPSFALSAPVVRFIGLFDTVVALGGRRGDPPLPLRLRLPAGIADKVVQLVARDEHRVHFALTSVAPEHEEIQLPGAHSDIGGGNIRSEEGPKLLTRPRGQRIMKHPFADFATPDKAWLYATPSHREAEVQAMEWRRQLGLDATSIWVDSWHQWQQQRQAGSPSVLPTAVLYVYSAVVLKRPIDWRYQLIALRLMHQRAQEAGVAWASAPDDVADMALPEELRSIARQLIAGGPLDEAQHALLRRRYLTRSAHWNFDALGDTALTFAADAGVSELPFRPGPGLFYINRPTEDGRRVVLGNT